MLELARSPLSADRDRLLLALADLCERNAGDGAPPEALVNEVFTTLVARVERDIRLRLATRLAHATWAPHALVLLLAHDEVEIARPLLTSSPILQDQDLVRLLVETAPDSQIEIARRPNLGAAVVGAILDQASPDVLTALAGNASAQISPLGMERLVAFSPGGGLASGAALAPSRS